MVRLLKKIKTWQRKKKLHLPVLAVLPRTAFEMTSFNGPADLKKSIREKRKKKSHLPGVFVRPRTALDIISFDGTADKKNQ